MSEQCSCCKADTKKENNDVFLYYSTTDTLSIPETTSVGTSFRITTLRTDDFHEQDFTIRFNFSCNLVTEAAIGNINFQIFKQCSDQLTPIPVGSVFNYTKLFLGGDATAFSFKACDTNHDNCCIYFVLVTVAGTPTTGLISIANANLSALVSVDSYSSDQQQCCCCKQCGRIYTKYGASSNVPIAGETPAGESFTLASLSINPKNFNCPCIELEFTTNVIFPESFLVAFIQIFKQCECQIAPIPVGPVWLLEHPLPESNYNTFTFHVHDCMKKTGGCCTYYALLTVQLTVGEQTTLFRNSLLRATIADNVCM